MAVQAAAFSFQWSSHISASGSSFSAPPKWTGSLDAVQNLLDPPAPAFSSL